MQNSKTIAATVGGILIGVSAALLSLVTGHEGVRYQAYLDSANVPTICWGHTKGVRIGMTATRAQCLAWLDEDLGIAQIAVRKHLKAPATRNQLDSYTSFVFNVGENAFARSSMLRKANAGDRTGSCLEFHRWVYVGKLDCRLSSSRCGGIPKRRTDEAALCLRPNNEVIQPWKPQPN